ncbi:MAG: hypothetical protein A2033_16155 [Bacteroidetes bacterium GWA2_31_9]|nr:MAG: hypothetical protein A2033_16155 [Bacteroidetes bacterium GWA2_31_9]
MKNKKLTSIKKFYFLEYFDILLKSLKFSPDEDVAFFYFIDLKDKNKLGESRYKKINPIVEELSSLRVYHYKYTFLEVIEESKFLKLICKEKKSYYLTELGTKLLNISINEGIEKFNYEIFLLMEEKLQGFYYLIESCYKTNQSKNGLLIFPIYSPLKLNMTKNEIVNNSDITTYLNSLQKKIEEDIKLHLGKKIDLDVANNDLKIRIEKSGLINQEKNSDSIYLNYNKILKRIRDFWINYFLKEIYKFDLSLSYFELWVYRAKQLGIINTHEFYPGFNGKIVYPISLIMKEKASTDFKKLYTYNNGNNLYAHIPKWKENQHNFVETLFESYHDIKAKSKSYFINLADLRDMVCFKMKISERTFTEFLKKAYLLNLRNNLKIKISLETDKIPLEKKMEYLKREPVLIGGKLKNIIAIELKK